MKTDTVQLSTAELKTADKRYRRSIKHMVCPRCIQAVERIVRELGLEPIAVVLGEVTLKSQPSAQQLDVLKDRLEAAGFAFTETESARLINQVKSFIIDRIHHGGDSSLKLSVELAQHTHCEYSRLSKLFSMSECITIERYAALQRIEKVKELLVYDEQNISEIALFLDYSSPAHLTAQFKKITGMTPSQFRALGVGGRRGLDAVQPRKSSQKTDVRDQI
ncbi:helix-turn-helix domain-containing protein [Coraliomargarita sp. W4R53]